MDMIQSKFFQVKAFVFDVDGVLSADTSILDEQGNPVRTANVKDGFAIRMALKMGYEVCIITGGFQERVRLRYKMLGVRHYYENSRDKVLCLADFMNSTNIPAGNILFMGDDLVDFQAMQKTGCPVCPIDAVQEIKDISVYISDKRGGEGCARDVIEKVLKSQDNWKTETMFQEQSV